MLLTNMKRGENYMGKLIDTIRSWFCKHEWECLMDGVPVFYSTSHSIPSQYKWLYVCKKCKRKKVVTSDEK